MKKTLKLVKNGLNYELKDTEIVLITIIDKKINGEDIYEKVYKDLPKNSKIEIVIEPEGFEFEGTRIKEKEDRLVFDQIKTIFSKIDQEISNTIITE